MEYKKKDYTKGHLRQTIKIRHQSGFTIRQICNQLNIGSTRTVHKWIKSDTIESKSSAPKNPHKKYDDKQLYYLYMIRKFFNYSIDGCKEILEYNGIFMPRSTCAYYIKTWGLSQKNLNKNLHKFKKYDPGYVHIDITYGPVINGKKTYIYAGIDRATRLLYIEVHNDKKAETAADFLRKLLKFFPFEINIVLTDNGKEFTLKKHKGKYDLTGAFDFVCNEFGIEHRLTKVGHPWTNGMIEKTNDIIKTNTVKKNIYDTYKQMVQDLKRFMYDFNIKRRHGGLVKENKGKTPYDALLMYYEIVPEIFVYSPIEFLDKITIYCYDDT